MTSKTRKTVTVVRYLVQSSIPVLIVWGYELGQEGFNALLRSPWTNPFSWFVLVVGLVQAACQAVGALINADLTKQPLADPPQYGTKPKTVSP